MPKIEQFELWIADLNPRMGTEAGKMRPVVVVQTNFLNKIGHPSTIICPLTTKVAPESNILRIHLKKGIANLNSNCDVMIDQIRAIDNQRLTKRIGRVPQEIGESILENLNIILT